MSKPRKKRSIIWKIESDVFKNIVQENIIPSRILEYFGLQKTGSNYRVLKERINAEKIVVKTIDRMELYKNRGVKSKIPLDVIMVENSTYSTKHLKERLLKEGLLENKCAICGHPPTWNNKPLVLILDHINGKNNDHRIENLRLLCPNCNSQTDTFAGRNSRKIINCNCCGKVLNKKSPTGLCISCFGKTKRKAERPSKEALDQLIAKFGFRGVGKIYGVSDNTIRKWQKTHGPMV